MKKIDLITGFLGSGKTTFIKEYVRYLISKGEKVCILENDFGAVNVDMMLLQDLRSENCELEMVAGGCDRDCYRRRFKTKLIAMGMDEYTRIVIEPSGIFDVDEFFDSLYDEPLCNWYEIGNVIAVAQADMNRNLSEESVGLLASEVACAGKVVLSRTQCTTKEEIEATKEYIISSLKYVKCNRDISSDFIAKSWADFTDADYKLIASSGYKKESFAKNISNQESYDSVCFLDKGFDPNYAKEFAETLFADETKYGKIIRVKGFCFSDDNWTEINVTNSSTEINNIGEGQDVIIVIGENLVKDEIESLAKYYYQK